MKALLLADRLGRAEPTGIGMYVAAMLDELPRADLTARFVATAYHLPATTLCSTRPNLRYARVAGGARLNYLLGGLTRLPLLDWTLPACNLIHALLPLVTATCRPLVVTVHDLTPLTHPSYYPVQDRLAFRLDLRSSLRRAQRLIAVSQRTADDLQLCYGVARERISVIYHGVEQQAVQLDAIARAELRSRYGLAGRFVLFSGTITLRKNLPLLVQAFAAVAREVPDVRLVLAGKDGYGAAQVREAIRAQGLERRVSLPGYVPRADLLGLLALADLFVFPSTYEGFGWPPLEAMVQGTPVVATRGGSIPEIVGDAALLSEPRDSAGLAGAILALLRDNELAARLRCLGYARAQQFTFARMARETLAVYHQVLASP